jgi:hypothetical protein
MAYWTYIMHLKALGENDRNMKYWFGNRFKAILL